MVIRAARARPRDPRAADRAPSARGGVEAVAVQGRVALAAPDARLPPELPLPASRRARSARSASLLMTLVFAHASLFGHVLPHPHADRRLDARRGRDAARRLRPLRPRVRRLPARRPRSVVRALGRSGPARARARARSRLRRSGSGGRRASWSRTGSPAVSAASPRSGSRSWPRRWSSSASRSSSRRSCSRCSGCAVARATPELSVRSAGPTGFSACRPWGRRARAGPRGSRARTRPETVQRRGHDGVARPDRAARGQLLLAEVRAEGRACRCSRRGRSRRSRTPSLAAARSGLPRPPTRLTSRRCRRPGRPSRHAREGRASVRGDRRDLVPELEHRQPEERDGRDHHRGHGREQPRDGEDEYDRQEAREGDDQRGRMRDGTACPCRRSAEHAAARTSRSALVPLMTVPNGISAGSSAATTADGDERPVAGSAAGGAEVLRTAPRGRAGRDR